MSTSGKKTSLLALILKIYAPIASYIHANLATKTELSQNEAEHFHPVGISSLTPSSTFAKNSVIGINGVLYRSTQATSNFPVTLMVQDGSFVVNTVNGKISFVVVDPTVLQGWEIFTDASIEYWIESINQSIADISTIRSNAQSAIKPTDVVTYEGTEYSVSTLLSEVAKLMNKTVVTN